MTQSIMDDIDTNLSGNAKLKVVGVGGAGGNAVQEMIDAKLSGVQFICANTDMQALGKSSAQVKIQLGEKLTRGLGAGANPAVGREAAQESINAIKDAIGDADMVFVTAGLGGGTGTGAAPIIAQVAKELNALTVGVVTKPFSYEGRRRMNIAENGLEELKKNVDCLIVIPNDRLCGSGPKKTPFTAMLKKANEVLLNGVRSISEVINQEGHINVDFADVRTTMAESGLALMGTGRANGENRAREAALQAIMSPLLENVSLDSARAILYNITATEDITMEEVDEIGQMINDAVSSNDLNNNIIFGIAFDENMGEDLQVTIIATGIQPPLEAEDVSSEKVIPFRNNQGRANSNRFMNNRNAQQEQPVDQAEQQPARSQRQPEEFLYEDPLPRNPYSRPRDIHGYHISRHAPGHDSFTYDEEDLEVPAFLRTQAD